MFEFHVGIDDTDSPLGGCTTYTMALVTDELKRQGFELDGYPSLVRLNPNVPWKTRGNAALALHMRTLPERVEMIKETFVNIVRSTSQTLEPRTDPAIVFLTGPVPAVLVEFYENALADVVPVEYAVEMARQTGAETVLPKGPRGLVGALASIGADLTSKDHTFEIIAYRTSKKLGTPRKLDRDSVRRMDKKFHGQTFNNVDVETGRVLIAPHGPDPVLFGIRGEDAQVVSEAYSMVDPGEPVERTCIFLTNQGTDAHLVRSRTVRTLQAYQSGNVEGTVGSIPRSMRGGHVFFRLDQTDGSVACAAYEPTGPFRHVILALVPGDHVRAYGGVRQTPTGRLTFNLEKLDVLSLAESLETVWERCDNCGGSFESMGNAQGLRCRKCGIRKSRVAKTTVKHERHVRLGTYVPPARANRHLTRPENRRVIIS